MKLNVGPATLENLGKNVRLQAQVEFEGGLGHFLGRA